MRALAEQLGLRLMQPLGVRFLGCAAAGVKMSRRAQAPRLCEALCEAKGLERDSPT